MYNAKNWLICALSMICLGYMLRYEMHEHLLSSLLTFASGTCIVQAVVIHAINKDWM